MSHPERVLGVSKRLNRLLDDAEAHESKASPSWWDRANRAWMPIAFTGYRKERFGIINRFMESATKFVEATRTLGSTALTQLTENSKRFDDLFGEAIRGQEITSDYVMDGIIVRTRTPSIPFVKFLGSVRNKNNALMHKIEHDGKEYMIPEGDITREEITENLKRKYRDELANEIMSGETRNITFSDMPNKEEFAQILKVLNQAKARKKRGESEGRMHTYNKQVGNSNYEFTVVMVQQKQQGEIQEGQWKAFIINHRKEGSETTVNYFDKKGKTNKSKKLFNATEVFQGMDGYHKSKEWRASGPILNRRNVPFKNSFDKQPVFNENSRMKNQPSPRLMNGIQGIDGGLFSFIADTRATLEIFADDVIVRKKKENQARISRAFKILKNNPKMAELIGYNPELTDSEGEPVDVLDQVLNHFDMRNMLYVKKDGTIHTRNSFFKKKKENYFPQMWDDSTVIDMINTAIGDIQLRASELTDFIPENEEEQAEMDDIEEKASQDIEELKTIKTLITNESARYDSKGNLALGVQAAMTKHRKLWTDPALRRKDGQVLSDYVNSTIFGMQSESLYADALDTIVNLAMTAGGKHKKMFESELSVVHNRLKLTLNDPTADAFMPLWGDTDLHYNNKHFANMLNWVGKKVGWNKHYDEVSAQKFILTQRALTSAALLGPFGAMVNRSQAMNTIISTGWKFWNLGSAVLDNGLIVPEGHGDLSGLDFNRIIDKTGTDQLVSAFADAVAPVSEVESTDRAYSIYTQNLPGGQFIPAEALKRFMSMKWYNDSGKDLFIKKGDPDIDVFLEQMEERRVDRFTIWKQPVKEGKLPSKDAKHIKNFLNILDREQLLEGNYDRTRKIEELREVFVDLIRTPKEDNNRETLEAKYKLLFGQMEEERLQKMVAYKLSFWWEGRGPKGWLTFTEGEREMRQHAVISHLLFHYEAGTLTRTAKKEALDLEGKELMYNIFESDDAVRIARTAVRNEYFGMTKVHMGEAFAGLGHTIWQYKGYPLQQMKHDWKVAQAFANDSGTARGIVRLTKELGNIYSEKVNKKGFDPKDPNVDPDARAMLRLLGSRAIMSAIGVTTELVPMFSRLMMGSSHRIFKNMMSGAENPAMKIGMRIIANGMVMMALDDDEKAENAVMDTGIDILRLFMPLWVTFWPLVARNVYKTYERFD